MEKENKLLLSGASGLLVTVVGTITLCMWGCPRYNVYEKEMSGKAAYAKAEQDRKIAVLEASAKMESASKLAEAEVLRAEGVAKANKIIGESLRGNESYLRYLWINNLEGGGNETVIYVPTEAGLPILEANRLKK